VVQQLSQLSAMVNLQHLSLALLPDGGVPEGLPPQLVELTYLYIEYNGTGMDTAGHFQHLSRFTALQELRIYFVNLPASDLYGIADMSQLKNLCLYVGGLDFSTASTQAWAQLTALESLSLSGCVVQPAALAAFTQLRSLSWCISHPQNDAQLSDMLSAVSGLSLLKELNVIAVGTAVLPVAPVAVLTALTASTNLRRLQLTWSFVQQHHIATQEELFRPGTICPHLHTIDLQSR
jgi:hypothetical protein